MDLIHVALRGANLFAANLQGADLNMANVEAANLEGCDLGGDQLFRTELSGSCLMHVNLQMADARIANFDNADLTEATLGSTILTLSRLNQTDLTSANLGATFLIRVDLSSCEGLETCEHEGPSFVDHRTLQRSWPLPLAFLRGVGLPDNLIEYLSSQLNQAIQCYSCFISYSSRDQEFAERLHADL
jgi:uncharacterized protein YjbI with pentapeptide repeats